MEEYWPIRLGVETDLTGPEQSQATEGEGACNAGTSSEAEDSDKDEFDRSRRRGLYQTDVGAWRDELT